MNRIFFVEAGVAGLYGEQPVSSSLKQSSGLGGRRKRRRTYTTGDRCSKYRIVGLIDEGGMGEVYDARDEYLNRRVALKVVRVQHQGERLFAAGNQKEAQVLAELDHPNIVRLYDAGVTDEGVVYLVMERVDGRSLRYLLHWMRVFDVRSALSIAAQIADALRVAHKSGIVHRDLKPENVLVQPSGKLKVVDFGIAKRLAATDRAASTDPFADILTAHYASPEQALGHGACKASDVYALGTIVYEMTTGKHPFAPEKGEMPTRQEVLLNHILASPKRLSELGVARDAPGLSDLVAAMLAKAPGERPTAQEAYEALTAELARYEAAHPHAPGRLAVGAERRGADEEEAPVVVDEERGLVESGGRGRGGQTAGGPEAPRAAMPPAVSAEVLRYVTAPLPEDFRIPAEPLPFAAARDAREGSSPSYAATAPAPRWLKTERMGPAQEMAPAHPAPAPAAGAVLPERAAPAVAGHGTEPWPAPAPAATTAPVAAPAAGEEGRRALPEPAAPAGPAAPRAAEQEAAGAKGPPSGAAVAQRAGAAHDERRVDRARRGARALRHAGLAGLLAVVAGVSFVIGRYPAASSLRGAGVPVDAPGVATAGTIASAAEAPQATGGSTALPVDPPVSPSSSPSASVTPPAAAQAAAPGAAADRAVPDVARAPLRSAPAQPPAAEVAGPAPAPRAQGAPRRAARPVDDPGFYDRIVEEEVYDAPPASRSLPAARPVPSAPASEPPARKAPRRAPATAPHRPLH